MHTVLMACLHNMKKHTSLNQMVQVLSTFETGGTIGILSSHLNLRICKWSKRLDPDNFPCFLPKECMGNTQNCS